MFIEIKRLNHKGDELVNLVNTDTIINVKELTQEDQDLYDSEGNLVETRKPTERLFLVFLKGGQKIKIKENTYNELKKALTK